MFRLATRAKLILIFFRDDNSGPEIKNKKK